MPFCPCIVFNPFFLCVPGSFFCLPIFVWIFFSTNSLSLEFLMFLIQFVEYFWKFNCCFYTFLLFSDLSQVFFLFPPLESVFCVNLVFCFDSSGFCQMFFNNSFQFYIKIPYQKRNIQEMSLSRYRPPLTNWDLTFIETSFSP